MQSRDIEAKTVQEAIELACRELHTGEENLHIEILEESPGKLMSFFSGKKAKIRARRLDTPDTPHAESTPDAVQSLREILETIVRHIHDNATIDIRQEHGETVFNISGDGTGLFIGKRGQTLESFQYLINKIRMNAYRQAPHITVDSEQYRSKHVTSLITLARKLSDKAKQRNGPVTTNPLSASDRRVIHMALKQDTDMMTWSKGEGFLKKVIIAPKQSPNEV
jgi:spoIIIJ-associated protein